MSIVNRGIEGVSIGERIRTARKALKLSQGEFADRCGVVLKTQSRFERDENLPGAEYLLRAAGAGIDVNFALFGLAGTRDEIESALLLRFRAASQDVQGAVLRALGIPATGNKRAAVSITGGEQGQVIAGDVQQRGVTINVGGKKRGAAK